MKKELTREKILETSAFLISKYGYKKFSIRSLAKELEMSPTNIYNYFVNLDEILLHLLNRGFDMLLLHRNTAYNRAEKPLDGVENVLWAIYDFSINHYDIYEILYVQKIFIDVNKYEGTKLESLSKKVADARYHGFNFWEDILKEVLPESNTVDRKITTLQIGHLIHGALGYYHNKQKDNNFVNSDEVVRKAIEHILDNLKNKSDK